MTHFFRRIKLYGLRIHAELIIASEILQEEVVRMDVVARGDPALGEPDDLAIFLHRRAVFDFPDGDLMPWRDILPDMKGSRTVSQLVPGFHGPFENRDAIGVAEQQGDVVEVSLGHSKENMALVSLRQITTLPPESLSSKHRQKITAIIES
jgi:hypothetical protein